MRIIISFPLILVFCSFPRSFETAITKGLESFPETSQDFSSGETTQTPEVSDVPNLLNDVEQLQTDRTEASITNSMGKRCIRREVIVGSPRGRNTALSLKRRDINVEKRKQQCENCKKRPLCLKYKACATCKRYCGNVEDEATTVENTDNNGPITEPESNVVGETEAMTENLDLDNEAIVASRFGESSEESIESKPRYYSLGSVQPGPLMHLFAKAFNIPSEENFEKLIILGQVKGSKHPENLDELVIIDLAQVFGTDKKNTATIHQSNANIDPAKIEELDRALEAALAKRKQELNTDQLSTGQIHEVINQVLEEINQGRKPVENVMTATVTDPSVQLQETQTKCSVDEAVDDLIDAMSGSTPERTHEIKQHVENEAAGEEEEIDKEELPHLINNPSVIQDSADVVSKNLDDGWVDDNEEARPSVMIDNVVQKPKLFTKDSRKTALPNDNNPVDNMIGNPPKETEVLTLPDEMKHGLESENQVNNPVGAQQTVDGDSDNQTGKVGDSDSKSSARQKLEENIFKIVEDSLKTVSSSDNLLEATDENLRETHNEEDKEDPIEKFERTNSDDGPIIAQEPKPIFVENEPNQANTNNLKKVIQIPQTLQSTPQVKDETLSNPEQNNVSLKSKETAEVGDSKLIGMQNPEPMTPRIITEPEMVEKVPDFVSRDQFSDESVSQEKLTNFGALVPAGINENSPTKKVYFVGKDIKLPLRMFQDENGVMQLRVDMKKLCHCKDKNCTKKHADSREVEQKVTDEKEYRVEQNTILPELNVRFGRASQINEQLMDSFVDSAQSHDENSDKYKRSPNIDSEYKNLLDDQENRKHITKNDELIKLEREDEKLENKLEKLSKNFEKYNEENPHLLNKGNVALFNDVEKTKDVGRMITLANNVLSWMKELATKNLRS